MKMFYKVVFVVLAALALPFQSCTQNSGVGGSGFRVMLKTLLSHSVPEISVQTAAEQNNALFLDAREQTEYEVSHIKDAVFVGYDNFDLETLTDIPKDQPLIVYCSVGYRSEKVSEQLIEAGYTDVKNLYGGIFEWKNEDMPVVDEANEPTEKVHAYSRSWGVWLKKGEKVY